MSNLLWAFPLPSPHCDVFGTVTIQDIVNTFFDAPLSVTFRYWDRSHLIFDDVYLNPRTAEWSLLRRTAQKYAFQDIQVLDLLI